MTLLLAFLACESEPAPPLSALPTRPSAHGPDMVRIPGAIVRHGQKAGAKFVFDAPGAPPPGGGALGPPGPPPTGGAGHPQAGAAPSSGAPGALPDLGASAGTQHGFTKADPDPLEAREVEVGAFWIDLTEVTQAQYAEFLAGTGYRPPFVDEPWAMDGYSWTSHEAPAETADHPVILVSWYDATAYCTWADKRLPTEPEWQLAVLGSAKEERNYPWGAAVGDGHYNHGRMVDPNYDDSDGYARTSPVTAFPTGRSWAGLYDGFGNAWEWTADWRVQDWTKVSGDTRDGRLVDPHTDGMALYAAVRGGSFFFDLGPNPAGERNAFVAELRRKSSGFRCAADAGPTDAT